MSIPKVKPLRLKLLTCLNRIFQIVKVNQLNTILQWTINLALFLLQRVLMVKTTNLRKFQLIQRQKQVFFVKVLQLLSMFMRQRLVMSMLSMSSKIPILSCQVQLWKQMVAQVLFQEHALLKMMHQQVRIIRLQHRPELQLLMELSINLMAYVKTKVMHNQLVKFLVLLRRSLMFIVRWQQQKLRQLPQVQLSFIIKIPKAIPLQEMKPIRIRLLFLPLLLRQKMVKSCQAKLHQVVRHTTQVMITNQVRSKKKAQPMSLFQARQSVQRPVRWLKAQQK